MNVVRERICYDVNVCGGDFGYVCECFVMWKCELLVYWLECCMFDGKDEVCVLNDIVYDGLECVQQVFIV